MCARVALLQAISHEVDSACCCEPLWSSTRNADRADTVGACKIAGQLVCKRWYEPGQLIMETLCLSSPQGPYKVEARLPFRCADKSWPSETSTFLSCTAETLRMVDPR